MKECPWCTQSYQLLIGLTTLFFFIRPGERSDFAGRQDRTQSCTSHHSLVLSRISLRINRESSLEMLLARWTLFSQPLKSASLSLSMNCRSFTMSPCEHTPFAESSSLRMYHFSHQIRNSPLLTTATPHFNVNVFRPLRQCFSVSLLSCERSAGVSRPPCHRHRRTRYSENSPYASTRLS